jgi:hypothetical protein
MIYGGDGDDGDDDDNGFLLCLFLQNKTTAGCVVGGGRMPRNVLPYFLREYPIEVISSPHSSALLLLPTAFTTWRREGRLMAEEK